ncbi:MAG: phytoene/squalene synthase family protein [Saprospiraceae bacterium]|nr:phytoene/squalene synthase family protein [Saprospiraceae bacterium]
MELYSKVCFECNKIITNQYSTSFSLGIRMFSSHLRSPIYAIYGFVRFADEIVDTFHDHDKETLLKDFRIETFKAIDQRLSLNPVLHSFQEVVHKYNIDTHLIEAFLDSMEMDLFQNIYDKKDLDKYIYGSAEVVGLMCLHVFLDGNKNEYENLKPFAKSLGSAFQKINFLRDMKSDYEERGRVYFPDVNFHHFQEEDKKLIEADIQKEFDYAYLGIVKLPKSSRLGVYTAFKYYINLFNKIKALPAATITERRIRVSDKRKIYLLTTSAIKFNFNLI